MQKATASPAEKKIPGARKNTGNLKYSQFVPIDIASNPESLFQKENTLLVDQFLAEAFGFVIRRPNEKFKVIAMVLLNLHQRLFLL